MNDYVMKKITAIVLLAFNIGDAICMNIKVKNHNISVGNLLQYSSKHFERVGMPNEDEVNCYCCFGLCVCGKSNNPNKKKPDCNIADFKDEANVFTTALALNNENAHKSCTCELYSCFIQHEARYALNNPYNAEYNSELDLSVLVCCGLIKKVDIDVKGANNNIYHWQKTILGAPKTVKNTAIKTFFNLYCETVYKNIVAKAKGEL